MEKNKKILIVCPRNVVQGPMAESLFNHMGCSLFGWQVKSVGLSVSKSTDGRLVSEILQKFAVPHFEKESKVLRSSDIKSSGRILCTDSQILQHLKSTYYGCEEKLGLLGDFYPSPGIQIPDPALFTDDPKGYEKCYWLVYKSVKGLVKKLKEIDEENKPKENINKKVTEGGGG
ncbi:low molecular weight phosphotyrosine protein phosphatase [Eurytemora carolleeae]|uniref:low molecular weight phosphotyrosine protein phosphatase n=1 Tax=Eurytemora carolleeae TaxID=1294199 RepID=UPI000C7917CC|nr:low molecular weight phosphotyrosine protein phosphatase [Eurytemora carolleeae]|eukprot:XP_023347326.1 low molecular weight phosphotyrosine protein phosphatase-like [Eurytemora affinis]